MKQRWLPFEKITTWVMTKPQQVRVSFIAIFTICAVVRCILDHESPVIWFYGIAVGSNLTSYCVERFIEPLRKENLELADKQIAALRQGFSESQLQNAALMEMIRLQKPENDNHRRMN